MLERVQSQMPRQGQDQTTEYFVNLDRLVCSIKLEVYCLLNLQESFCEKQSAKKHSIEKNSQQIIDDLRRIQSLLKGYVKAKKNLNTACDVRPQSFSNMHGSLAFSQERYEKGTPKKQTVLKATFSGDSYHEVTGEITSNEEKSIKEAKQVALNNSQKRQRWERMTSFFREVLKTSAASVNFTAKEKLQKAKAHSHVRQICQQQKKQEFDISRLSNKISSHCKESVMQMSATNQECLQLVHSLKTLFNDQAKKCKV